LNTNPVHVFTHNFVTKKLQEKQSNPYDKVNSFFDAILTLALVPAFAISVALFLVSRFLYPSFESNNIHMLIVALVSAAGLIASVSYVVRDHQKWKKEQQRWENKITEYSSKIRGYNPDHTHIFSYGIITKCELIEQDDVPLCKVDLKLNTGEQLKDLLTVRSSLFEYISQYRISGYRLTQVNVNKEHLVSYMEDSVWKDERMTQQSLLGGE